MEKQANPIGGAAERHTWTVRLSPGAQNRPGGEVSCPPPGLCGTLRPCDDYPAEVASEVARAAITSLPRQRRLTTRGEIGRAAGSKRWVASSSFCPKKGRSSHLLSQIFSIFGGAIGARMSQAAAKSFPVNSIRPPEVVFNSVWWGSPRRTNDPVRCPEHRTRPR